VRVFPVDRERFIYLKVLAGLNAAATKNALIGIVAIERIRIVNFVRLGTKGDLLMLDTQQPGGVMDRAVSITVVADSAIQKMIAKNAIECFALRLRSRRRIRFDAHSRRNSGRTRPGELAIDLDHASVAGLYWTKLRVITNLRQLRATSIDDVNESLIRICVLDGTINCYTEHL
jgi:hypothetical protein